MSSPVTGRIVQLSDLTPTDIAAWTELAQRTNHANPLFEPACLLPASHLVNAGEIHLAIASAGTTMHGCFPFQVVDRWRALRQPVITSQVRRMQYDSTPLIDAELGVDAAAAMMRAVAAPGHPLPGILVNEWIADGPVAAAFERAAAGLGRHAYRYIEWERPMIRRRENGDYRSDKPSKARRELRRRRRKMGEDHDAQVTLVDCTHEPGIVDTVISMEAQTYKGRDGIAIAQHPGERQWFEEMCRNFDEQGRLRIFALDVGDRHVAIQLLLRTGEGMFGLKILYDEEFREYGPGMLLMYEVMEDLFENTDIAWIDPCTYEGNETLLRVYPDRHKMMSLATAVGGRRDRALLATVRAGRHLKSELANRNNSVVAAA